MSNLEHDCPLNLLGITANTWDFRNRAACEDSDGLGRSPPHPCTEDLCEAMATTKAALRPLYGYRYSVTRTMLLYGCGAISEEPPQTTPKRKCCALGSLAP